jgi:ArsR family transcriptional regulator
MLTTSQPPEACAPPNHLADGPQRPAESPLPLDTTRDLVQLFKLLADETRLRILYYLMQTEELNVCALCRLLGQSQPAVSHHLALLKGAGIIQCRRDGKNNFYRLVPKRCQEYLNIVFGVNGQETRKVRIDEAQLIYGPDVQPA